MGIDDIKPAGGYRPPDLDADAPAASRRRSSFPNGESEVRAADAADACRPSGVVAQFTRSELQDPQKLDGIVRALASELIESGRGFGGALSGADREAVLDFVARDPLLRRHIENYLQKVLA